MARVSVQNIVAAGLALAVACLAGLPSKIDAALFDLRATAAQRPATGNVVVVAIDPKSIEAAGDWPWRRSVFADALTQLSGAGAAVVGFDVDFSARSTDGDDGVFSEAIALSPLSVILPTFVQQDGTTHLTPLAGLSRSAVRASVNLPIDSDGKVRSYFLNAPGEDRTFQSLAAALAAQPIDGPHVFRIDYGIRLNDIPVSSFEDVRRGAFAHSAVSGRIVLIGATASELGDTFATPAGATTPGVMIHALATESLLQGRQLTPASITVSILLAFAAAVALWPRRRTGRLDRAGLAFAGLVTAMVAATVALQAATPISLDIGLALCVATLCFWMRVADEIAARRADAFEMRESTLKQAALMDVETGRPNRRALFEALSVQSGSRGASCVLAIGVERYESLAGAVGQTLAQDAMTRFSHALEQVFANQKAYLASPSVICLVLESSDFAESATLKIEDCARSIDVGARDLRLDVRIGMSGIAPDARPVEMIGEAETALDQARRDRVPIRRYNAKMHDAQRRRIRLISAMREGIERGEFSLVYQPKIDLRLGAVSGLEALLRWDHPEWGAISPAEFVVLAEECGSIGMLTSFVLRRVAQEEGRLRRSGVVMPIAVNVSGRSIGDPDFVRECIETISRSQTPIAIEITETALIDDPSMAMAAIEQLRAVGADISIDDYGAGLSSLSYLKQIDADELKLDRSLLTDIATSARDRLIVKSTIDLAHGLDLRVVAEGIEDPEAVAILRAMGCDAAQGYYFARPMSAVDLCAWARHAPATIAALLPQRNLLIRQADYPPSLAPAKLP